MKYFLSLLFVPLLSFANPYEWPITRVIDGDTVAFRAPFLPLELKQELKLRIWGVDTPEKGALAECPYEADLGAQASVFTTNVVNRSVRREIYIKEWDKYGGRVIGDLILDGRNLRTMLLQQGLAREYYGYKKTSWCH